MRRLLTVEDTFLIVGRGLIVVPAPAIDAVRGPAEVSAELRRPDGTIVRVTLTLCVEFFSPPQPVRRWGCAFKGLGKDDVPIGTEVWCDDALFAVPPGDGA